ncbi:hypothetical protein ABW20_dc0105354 [Dactylellina cionopaga]|nr:hypothetical protein ABW20_dc0105354 [Dactylellina cionopaga]
MSSPFSVGDFLAVGTLVYKIYDKCKNSQNEFKDLTGEVASLHIVLEAIEKLWASLESSGQDLELDQKRYLGFLVNECHTVLTELEKLIDNTTKTTYIQAKLLDVMNKLHFEYQNGHRPAPVFSQVTAKRLGKRSTWQSIATEMISEGGGIDATMVTANQAFIKEWIKMVIIDEDEEHDMNNNLGNNSTDIEESDSESSTGSDAIQYPQPVPEASIEAKFRGFDSQSDRDVISTQRKVDVFLGFKNQGDPYTAAPRLASRQISSNSQEPISETYPETPVPNHLRSDYNRHENMIKEAQVEGGITLEEWFESVRQNNQDILVLPWGWKKKEERKSQGWWFPVERPSYERRDHDTKDWVFDHGFHNHIQSNEKPYLPLKSFSMIIFIAEEICASAILNAKVLYDQLPSNSRHKLFPSLPFFSHNIMTALNKLKDLPRNMALKGRSNPLDEMKALLELNPSYEHLEKRKGHCPNFLQQIHDESVSLLIKMQTILNELEADLKTVTGILVLFGILDPLNLGLPSQLDPEKWNDYAAREFSKRDYFSTAASGSYLRKEHTNSNEITGGLPHSNRLQVTVECKDGVFGSTERWIFSESFSELFQRNGADFATPWKESKQISSICTS